MNTVNIDHTEINPKEEAVVTFNRQQLDFLREALEYCDVSNEFKTRNFVTERQIDSLLGRVILYLEGDFEQSFDDNDFDFLSKAISFCVENDYPHLISPRNKTAAAFEFRNKVEQIIGILSKSEESELVCVA